MTEPDALQPLIDELATLRNRVAELESAEAGRARRRMRLRGVLLLSLVVGTTAFAQLVSFQPNAPAIAADVNGNFTQLKTWLEQKVGAAGSANVAITAATRIQTGTTSNAALSTGKALLVTANTGAPAVPIAEFRHDNQTQGVGIGYNTIYATGTAANQDLNLAARGTGLLFLQSPTTITGDLVVTSNTSTGSWLASTTRVPANGGTLAPGSAPNGNWTTLECSPGQYVCGLTFTHPAGQDGAFQESFSIRCCTL